jgi:hypothetical protein
MIPDAWKTPVAHPAVPANTKEGWVDYGLDANNALDKANDRQSDTLYMVKACDAINARKH